MLDPEAAALLLCTARKLRADHHPLSDSIPSSAYPDAPAASGKSTKSGTCAYIEGRWGSHA